jgi:3-dehydroquinate synthase
VGGASLLDLTGFASATMRSAPRVIRLPTTTLAQSGPAVLPASSINAFGTKDFLGTQRPPFAVLCDRRFPDTQRPRDKVAGLTQAVRAALLWDEGLLGWISAHAGRLGAGDRDTVAELVQKSAGLYASHAATLGAEDEDAASEALSYGTWSADRLALLADLRIRSGEALAIGIALDTVVSSLAGLIGGKERDLVVGTLERLGLRLWHDALGRADSEGRPLLLDGLAELCGGLAPRVPLLAGVGEGAVAHALRESVVREAIEWLSRRDAHRTCAWALA